MIGQVQFQHWCPYPPKFELKQAQEAADSAHSNLHPRKPGSRLGSTLQFVTPCTPTFMRSQQNSPGSPIFTMIKYDFSYVYNFISGISVLIEAKEDSTYAFAYNYGNLS